MNDALHREIAELRRENEWLRAEVAQLRGTDDTLWATLPVEWRLRPQERKMLALLLRCPRVSKSQAMASLYPDGDYDDTEYPKVLVHGLRRKLPFAIETIWGYGWTIEEATRKRVLAEIGWVA